LKFRKSSWVIIGFIVIAALAALFVFGAKKTQEQNTNSNNAVNLGVDEGIQES
jgi:flagellar basal body-associated protein FliL